MEEGGSSKDGGYDLSLPPRFFATDRFPSKRLNIYSKMDTILLVRDLLAGTPELERIRASGFGKLFELPAVRLPVSCKLLHSLLTRQLVTKKKFVIWPVFGGQPFRFSLVEFAAVTGLNCGDFPDDHDPEKEIPNKEISDSYWEKLIGLPRSATMNDIVEMMRRDRDMSSWRRLRLALLLIVDCVLVATGQTHKPTPKYVKMVEDVEAFLEFPWGRESFFWTIGKMRPGTVVVGRNEDPVSAYRLCLQQETFRLVGFPQALQLVAFEAIPGLLLKLRNGASLSPLVDFPGIKLPTKSLSLSDVEDVEDDKNLVVHAIVHGRIGDEEWDEEIRDKRVLYMEKQIQTGHKFSKSEWSGGEASLPLRRKKVAGNMIEEDSPVPGVGKSSKKSAGRVPAVTDVPSKCCCEEKLDLLVECVSDLCDQIQKINRRRKKKQMRRAAGIGSLSVRSQKTKRQSKSSVEMFAGAKGVPVYEDVHEPTMTPKESVVQAEKVDDQDAADGVVPDHKPEGRVAGEKELVVMSTVAGEDETRSPVAEIPGIEKPVDPLQTTVEMETFCADGMAGVEAPMDEDGFFCSQYDQRTDLNPNETVLEAGAELTPAFPLEQDRVWRVNAEGVVQSEEVLFRDCMVGEFLRDPMDSVAEVVRSVMTEHGRGPVSGDGCENEPDEHLGSGIPGVDVDSNPDKMVDEQSKCLGDEEERKVVDEHIEPGARTETNAMAVDDDMEEGRDVVDKEYALTNSMAVDEDMEEGRDVLVCLSDSSPPPSQLKNTSLPRWKWLWWKC